MTDEIIIVKFLDRNYRITTGHNDFVVIDTYDEAAYTPSSFPHIFKKIIGDFTSIGNETSIEIFHRWFGVKKRVLTKQLIEYFDTMDGSLGSKLLLSQAYETFEKAEYTQQFICNYFNDYYNKKFLIPTLDEYLRLFDKTKDSDELVELFDYALIKEGAYQHDFAVTYLNKWYCDTVIMDKINDFLSQLVITIGKTNWVVTWIGHGPITPFTLRNQFKKENGFQFNFIKGVYEEWYDKEVIDASERLMKKNPNFIINAEIEAVPASTLNDETRARRIATPDEIRLPFLNPTQLRTNLDDE